MKLVPLYRKAVKQAQEEENKKEHPYEKGYPKITLFSPSCRVMLQFMVTSNLELDDKSDSYLLRKWLTDDTIGKLLKSCFVADPDGNHYSLTEDWLNLSGDYF